MNKFSLTLLLLVALGFSASAQSYSNSITYQTITLATNTGATVVIGSARISPLQVQQQIQHSALTSTNNLATVFQISLDGANWATVQTNYPSSTNNGAIDASRVAAGTFTVYGRSVQMNTTTNVQSAGATIVLLPFSL